MIDQNVDQQGWFKVIEHVSDLHKHTANPGNKYYLSLITEAKVEIGDIILLTEFILMKKYYIKNPAQYSQIGEAAKDYSVGTFGH